MEELNTVLWLENFAGLLVSQFWVVLHQSFCVDIFVWYEYFSDSVHTQETEENVMFVRFYTNSRYPNNGLSAKVKIGKKDSLAEILFGIDLDLQCSMYFHVKVNKWTIVNCLGVCGGTRYLGKTGSVDIQSPDYPGHYRSNVDCLWSIRGPVGHYLTFTLVHLDLPNMFDCSSTDYLQVQEDNVTTPVLATWCGDMTRGPARVDSFGNNVRLLFHSDGNQQDKTGFVVRVNASIEGRV